ncbi:MAG: hypothetical protein HY064_04395 [Bacteroidetes bacterium]|nr:hypothetical protein [Bacteroidota bacterium]
MKNRFIKSWLLPAAVLVFALHSCGNDGDGKTPTDSTAGDSTATKGDTTKNLNMISVPSPTEVFGYMKMVGASNANSNYLNPTDNEKKYESKKSQSLNLGIYSADLLYCSTFGVSDKVLGYFGTCMRMGDKLKVATNLTDKDKDRISKNTGNGDSLVAISNDMYLSSFENLENTDRGGDLSLMLAGGWVESLYLMSNMVKDFDKDKSTAEHIAEQRLALGNLIEFMDKYAAKDADVKAVQDQIKDLKTLFDASQTSGTNSATSKKNGKLVIGGGAKTTLTKDQFDKIQSKLNEIRTGYINLQ